MQPSASAASSSETFAPVFLRVLQALSDRPDSVELGSDESEGKIVWSVTCDVNDAKKIAGKDKTRMLALNHWVKTCGDEAREEWSVYPVCVTTGEPVEDVPAKKSSVRPEHLVVLEELVSDMLKACGITCGTSSSGSGSEYVIHIATTAEHRAKLFAPNEHGQVLIGSCGTILRGVGGRVGVKIRLEVGK